MTQPGPHPTGSRPSHDEEETAAPRLGISAAQVTGSALAAISAAFLASRLGVAGTLVGAAVVSVIGTVGSAWYTYSLQRGHHVVRGVVPVGPVSARQAARELGPDTQEEAEEEAAQETDGSWRTWPWRRIGVGGAAVLVVVLLTLTVVEGIAGRPVSSITTGEDGSGTTIGHAVRPGGGDGDPSENPSPSVPATPSTSTSAEPTQEPTEQPSDTATPTPTDEPTVSPSPTPTTVTPSETPGVSPSP